MQYLCTTHTYCSTWFPAVTVHPPSLALQPSENTSVPGHSSARSRRNNNSKRSLSDCIMLISSRKLTTGNTPSIQVSHAEATLANRISLKWCQQKSQIREHLMINSFWILTGKKFSPNLQPFWNNAGPCHCSDVHTHCLQSTSATTEWELEKETDTDVENKNHKTTVRSFNYSPGKLNIRVYTFPRKAIACVFPAFAAWLKYSYARWK